MEHELLNSMKIVWIEETTSTNSEVLKYADNLPDGIILSARCQTSGRGQKGNKWEAEPYKNLSFSAMWSPEKFEAVDQFAISEAVALSVVDLLAKEGIPAKVKWPNDIYVDDRKICGILIEHSVMGREISRTIAGVGINVNQIRFISDAPNPVSMTSVTGREYDLELLLCNFDEILSRNVLKIATIQGREEMHQRFCREMWRFDGNAYHFRDKTRDEIYQGKIVCVNKNGMLSVLDILNGGISEYAFKEVEFIL